LVAAAVRAMAGGAEHRILLFAGSFQRFAILAAAERDDIGGQFLDTLLTHRRLPGGHDAGAAVAHAVAYLFRLTAPQPDIVGKIGKTRRAAGIGTVANRAIADEQTLAVAARLIVIRQLSDAAVFKRRIDDFHLLCGRSLRLPIFTDLAPAEPALEVA